MQKLFASFEEREIFRASARSAFNPGLCREKKGVLPTRTPHFSSVAEKECVSPLGPKTVCYLCDRSAQRIKKITKPLCACECHFLFIKRTRGDTMDTTLNDIQ